MQKDFDGWNQKKKAIDSEDSIHIGQQGDIWWCSLGINVGSEENGKNELFERPVLVIKKLNSQMMRVVPLTSRIINDKNHFPIYFNGSNASLKFSQLKTVSTKRFTRKLSTIDKSQFTKIAENIRKNIV